jgi:hypothetical protein
MSTKWEYAWFTSGTHHDVNVVLGWAMAQANEYGESGWELVNFQLRQNGDELCIMAMLKQPSTRVEKNVAAKDLARPAKKSLKKAPKKKTPEKTSKKTPEKPSKKKGK